MKILYTQKCVDEISLYKKQDVYCTIFEGEPHVAANGYAASGVLCAARVPPSGRAACERHGRLCGDDSSARRRKLPVLLVLGAGAPREFRGALLASAELRASTRPHCAYHCLSLDSYVQRS